jgi:hypothetical protein
MSVVDIKDIKMMFQYNKTKIWKITDEESLESVCSCCGSGLNIRDESHGYFNAGIDFLVDPVKDVSETDKYWTESVQLAEGLYLNIRHRKDIPAEIQNDEFEEEEW